MTITIYILECENDKYYVGRSVHPKDRILSHFNKHGSEWTKKYKPIRIIATFVGDEFDEEKWTLKTMETYGIDNVRGGSYTTVVMNATDKAKAQQTIRSLTDKCYKCGSAGHFATDCGVKCVSISDCDSDDSDNDRFPEEETIPEHITKDSPLVSDGIGAGMFQRKRAEAAMRNELTQFAIGERGMVVGLVQAAVHNGKKCTITGIMDETQRVRVRLDGGTLEIDIKTANIHRINADTRQPLSSRHFAVDCKKTQKECSMCEGTKRLYLGNGDWGDCIMCDSDEMGMEVEETIEAQNVKLFAENQKLQQKLNAIKTIICGN